MNENKLQEFIDTELGDGADFIDILEYFNLDAAEVFVFLWKSGLIDEDLLGSYLLDV